MVYMNKINVAYLSHGVYYGGATTSLFLLIKSVKNKEEFEKHLYTPSCKSEEMRNDFLKYCNDVEIQNVPLFLNDVFNTTPYNKFLQKKKISLQPLLDSLKSKNIHLLHLNSSVLCMVNKYVKENSDIKVVTHVREQIPKYGDGFAQSYMIEQIKNYSDAIITISDNEAKPFLGHPNLHVLPNPFDFSKIETIQSSFRKDNNISDEQILVGMMGQFHAGKGHLVFLQALKEIVQKNKTSKKFKFVIIGVFPDAPLWKRIAKKILLKKNYRKEVFDFIKNNQLQDYVLTTPYSYQIFGIVKAMNIMVRPALSGDPWGRDIIESMAIGKPIIATGTSDFFVKDNNTGYLVPPNNANKLSEKIAYLINNEEKVTEFGKNGFENIKKMCDINIFGNKVAHIYHNLVKENKI